MGIISLCDFLHHRTSGSAYGGFGLSHLMMCLKINNMSKQQVFFSTKSDLIKMMSIVEKRIPIEYVLMGTFESEVIKRENTISKYFPVRIVSESIRNELKRILICILFWEK